MKLVRVIAIVGAIGFALPASTALAQASQDSKPQSGPTANAKTGAAKTSDDTTKPASVSGVEVQATGKNPLADIPPEKRAQFDEEVAKAEAWKRYRQSTPGANTSVIDQAKDYPGLQTLLPAP